ncbi:MAG: hypothetical protein PHY82_07045 [Lentisphaeria bacterium]|nr:hypothetical protein [Lentisphaeria bacterium]
MADFIRKRTVTAARFWSFLAGILKGYDVAEAWEPVRSIFTLECGFRLWRAFERFQPILRSLLSRIQAPPQSLAKSATIHTLEHLRAIFPSDCCPVAAWQLRFQRTFAA